MLKRLLYLALIVAALLAVSAVSALAEEPLAVGSYGQVTIDNVFFRKTADQAGDFWARLPAGWQMKVLGTTTTGRGEKQILWYKVQGGTPKAPDRTYTGYIHSGYFVAVGSTTPTPTPAPGSTATVNSSTAIPSASSVSGYVRTIKSGVNIRKTPNGTVLTAKDEYKIPYNTVLAYSAGPTFADNFYWVRVTYRGITGYIRGDCWVQTNASGTAISGVKTTEVPNIVLPEGAEALGVITLTSGGVNFRQNPNGSILGRLAKGTKLNYYGTVTVNNGKELWYLTYSNDIGMYGYVLGTLAKVTSGATLPPPAATVTPTPANPSGNTGTVSGTLTTTADKLNLRKTPSLQAIVLVQIPKAKVKLSFTDAKVSGGITWYKVTYNNKTGWLHGSFVKVNSSNAGNTGNTGTATVAPSLTAVPDPSTFSDVAFTTADKVFIRKTPSMSGKQLNQVYSINTKLTYNMKYEVDTASNPTTPYTWYNVTYGATTGWIRGEFIRILTQEEKTAYVLTGDANAPKEASYSTLSMGSEGEAVTRLQQALVAQGFLAATDVTGTYTTATEKAVIAFQKAHGLTQDGIAGEKTQHALYNTVPVGTYNNSTVTANLYPVEMVDWFKGDIQSVWPITGTAVITDVYTGITFRAYRIFGGNHADIVPLTADDTRAFCQIYGTSTAQEIADRENELQTWRRRPLWVTVGGRTFAASMYGTPHNFSDSTVRSSNSKLKNNFVGQVCVHFVNSMTHDSATSKAHVDYDSAKNGNFGHQSAIKYAYNHSISGTK